MPENAFYEHKEGDYSMGLPQCPNCALGGQWMQPNGYCYSCGHFSKDRPTTRTIEIPDRCCDCHMFINRFGNGQPYCIIYSDDLDFVKYLKPDWCKVEKITVYERGE